MSTDHPDVSALHAARLTNPQKNSTLGGRDGSATILKEDSLWPLSFIQPSNGWPIAPVKPHSVMERARWLSRLQAWLYALSAAGEAVGVQLQFETGGDDA